MTKEEHTFLSGSIVREIASLGGNISSMVPPHVEVALKARFAEEDAQFSRPVPLRD